MKEGRWYGIRRKFLHSPTSRTGIDYKSRRENRWIVAIISREYISPKTERPKQKGFRIMSGLGVAFLEFERIIRLVFLSWK